MEPRRLSVRFTVTNGEGIETEAALKALHVFIQQNKLPGMLVDVADYSHVPSGPSYLLVGHEGDYAIDHLDGQAALVYDYKRELTGSLKERVTTALQRLAIFAVNVEAELGLKVDLSFVKVCLIDRLEAPNTEATYEVAKAEVLAATEEVFNGANVVLARIENDARETPQISAKLNGAPSLESIAAAATQTA